MQPFCKAETGYMESTLSRNYCCPLPVIY
uniref:Uncharacterized protein n=1 Tax=Anguilla anguilla TaxID=7936 RepID=A0A0E9S723_ANGAN